MKNEFIVNCNIKTCNHLFFNIKNNQMNNYSNNCKDINEDNNNGTIPELNRELFKAAFEMRYFDVLYRIIEKYYYENSHNIDIVESKIYSACDEAITFLQKKRFFDNGSRYDEIYKDMIESLNQIIKKFCSEKALISNDLNIITYKGIEVKFFRINDEFDYVLDFEKEPELNMTMFNYAIKKRDMVLAKKIIKEYYSKKSDIYAESKIFLACNNAIQNIQKNRWYFAESHVLSENTILMLHNIIIKYCGCYPEITYKNGITYYKNVVISSKSYSVGFGTEIIYDYVPDEKVKDLSNVKIITDETIQYYEDS